MKIPTAYSYIAISSYSETILNALISSQHVNNYWAGYGVAAQYTATNICRQVMLYDIRISAE